MSTTLREGLSRPAFYWGSIGFSLSLVLLLGLSLLLLFWRGVGIWNNNIPVTWALDIVSYDWWIGIACGALLTACVLAVNGSEEYVTLQYLSASLAVLAAVAAAVYPIIHLGRPWFFFWNLPYPNSFGLWPQVRSPLFWDAIDILAFLGIAVPFWYLGLLPALARKRDDAFGRVDHPDGPGTLRAQLYGILAIGWRGSAAHWRRWLHAQRALAVAGIGVVAVLQTGAAIMFSGTSEPGWHDTLMPIEFLGEAALAGLAVLLVLATAMHVIEGNAAVSQRHLESLAWAMLVAGTCAFYCFVVSQLTAAYGGDGAEAAALHRRLAGPQSWSFWLLVLAGLVPVQLFWLDAFRRLAAARCIIGLLVAAGIWGGHYMVIVATLQHDYLPVGSRPYRIGLWEWTNFAGTVGLFLTLLLGLLRCVPAATCHPAAHAVEARRRDPADPGVDAPLWGVSAEFSNARDAGAAWAYFERHPIARLDALTPAPLDRDFATSLVLVAALIGFFIGGASMFGFCAYADNYAYVLNIGGRPVFSWPDYVVPALSFGLLCSGVAAFLCMLILNRLPRLNHPAFNIPGIGRASWDRYFVVISHTRSAPDVERAEQGFQSLAVAPIALHRVRR